MAGQGIKCHVLEKKEIENYSLNVNNLVRAIQHRQEQRVVAKQHLSDRQIRRLIDAVSNQFKHDTGAQIGGQRVKYFQEIRSKFDPSTVSKEASIKFEKDWKDIDKRLGMLAGKDFVSQLSGRLQKRKGFSLTTNMQSIL